MSAVENLQPHRRLAIEISKERRGLERSPMRLESLNGFPQAFDGFRLVFIGRRNRLAERWSTGAH